MRLLFKLLRKNVNFWQLTGFAMANLVGAVIVLFGIQAYKDAAQVLKAPDSVFSGNYLVLSKEVSSVTTLAGALGAGPKTFKEAEIQEIADVEGVESVQMFRVATFPVYGAITFGGFQASTEMFLESVPDEVLDVDISRWTADVDDTSVPVVIPRTYLNFYNYGFAAARGTPQIGEDLFSAVPLRLIVRGREGRKEYKGRIVGLTDRLNTILVPDDFLAQANERFGTEEQKAPTRLIVEAGSEASKPLMDLVAERNYILDGGNEDSMRMLSVVRTIISIVVALGLLVSALAFFLLLISILLLIEKNRYKNVTLHELGYPDRMIALPYQALAVSVDVVVWIVGAVVTLLLYPVLSTLMQTISPEFEPSGPGLVLLASLGLCLFFALIHIWLIRRRIR